MSRPLTANEATLLAASISALISIIVTLLMLRFGPNYKQQISDLNREIKELAGTLASLLERQSSATELLERRLTEETNVQWQPSARIEATKDETFLILKSDREFRLHRITLLGPARAVVHELQESPDWDHLQSSGYRISIPNK